MKRREFLRTAASVALMGEARALRGARSGMFISLNGSLVGRVPGPNGRPVPAVGWPEFARLAAKVGYGGVDVNLKAAMDDGEQPTRALLSGLKIRPGICGFPAPVFGHEEAAFQEGLKKLPDAVKFAAGIGCPRMMVVLPPSSKTPKVELRKIYKDRLIAVSEVLRPYKVRLGMEFLGPMYMHTRLPYEFIWRMDEALDFAKECGSNIGLTLDSWHWYLSGATIDDILHAGKSRIVTVHVSDAKKEAPEDVRDNQRLLPGEGIINLIGFFQALKKIGYVDAVSPEPLGRIPPGTSPEEGARMGLDSTRAVMQKAGVI
ncbi:MAG TPA: sugar phosphate isomerase/epimerase family protein [Bryobacteraceae bacterium]|nr:sugar phosphate isomerase/epimerase family protein [Bryobacteraceae bacterium]